MSIERELRGNWDNVYYPAPEPMVEEAMAPGQQPGDVLVAEAGGGGGAAFGVYPGMGKRSQKSNIGEKMITGAPDFAAGTARGIATSAGGIGGDLQKIGRFAYALAADNQGGSFQDKLQRAAITMEDPTFLPSSEDLSKTGYTIPGTNFTIPPFAPAVPPGTTAFGMTAEERQQAAELGQNVGELVGDPVMLLKGGQMAVKGAVKAAETLAPKAGEMIIKGMENLGSPVQMNIVEPSKFNPKVELPKAIDAVANNPDLNTYLPLAEKAPSVALRLTKPEIQGTGEKGALTVADIGLVLEKSQLALNKGKPLDPTKPKDLVKAIEELQLKNISLQKELERFAKMQAQQLKNQFPGIIKVRKWCLKS